MSESDEQRLEFLPGYGHVGWANRVICAAAACGTGSPGPGGWAAGAALPGLAAPCRGTNQNPEARTS
jgi:hypothetical protein